MMDRSNRTRTPGCVVAVLLCLCCLRNAAVAQQRHALFLPEQRSISVRDPAQLPSARSRIIRTPPTVRQEQADARPRPTSLDEAIRIALENTNVVRVLSGMGTASTGLTIYAPAIRNTTIDQARALFDPSITGRTDFIRRETPGFDPASPLLTGSRSDTFDFDLDVNKRTLNGGTANLGVGTNRNIFRPDGFSQGPQITQSPSSVDFSFTQPLLQGRGVAVNVVPIVLARIETEQSYFRLKDSLQEMVRGVIQGYWDVVQARTDLWILEQQIRQVRWVYERASDFLEIGGASLAEVAQARASLANFNASLIAAKANLLNREASLRGILGLPPADEFKLIPTTPPIKEEMKFEWDALIELAEIRRPDLIELKLILEADEQLLLQARNRALPTVDAVALYRWNGLEGELPLGGNISTRPGQFTDWTLGVNFSVPLSLRESRARLRERELILASDRANLDQGLLRTVHSLAFAVRTVDQLYAQYVAFKEARAAAALDLEAQFEGYRAQRVNFLNVLLAINTWGNAVSSEAQSLTQFNAALANLERDSGTILETHGVRLFEERYNAIGPLGHLARERCYPAAMRPGPNSAQYQDSNEPAEEFFDLQTPIEYLDSSAEPSSRPQRLPPPYASDGPLR